MPGRRVNHSRESEQASSALRATRAIRSLEITIRQVPGRQGETDEGQRLGQTDETEGQRVVGERVDLPRHHHRLELGGDVHRQQADDEPAEIRDPQRGVRIVSRDGADMAAGR